MFNCNVPFPGGSSPEHIFAWEVEKTRLQKNLEDSICGVLAHEQNKRCVLLCDRGVMDARAYVDQHSEVWTNILNAVDTTQESVMRRYKMVIHMTSTAVDAVRLYEGGGSRREDASLAAKVDSNVYGAWKEHPHHISVSNEDVDVCQKAQNAFRYATAAIGFPVPPSEPLGIWYPLPAELMQRSGDDLPLAAHRIVFTTVILQSSSTVKEYVTLSWPVDSGIGHSVLGVHSTDVDVQHDLVTSEAEATTMLEVRHPGCRDITRSQVRWCDGQSYIVFETVEGRSGGVYVFGKFPYACLQKLCTSLQVTYCADAVVHSGGPNYFELALTNTSPAVSNL